MQAVDYQESSRFPIEVVSSICTRRDHHLSGGEEDHSVDQIDDEHLLRTVVLQQKAPQPRAIMITEGSVPASPSACRAVEISRFSGTNSFHT